MGPGPAMTRGARHPPLGGRRPPYLFPGLAGRPPRRSTQSHAPGGEHLRPCGGITNTGAYDRHYFIAPGLHQAPCRNIIRQLPVPVGPPPAAYVISWKVVSGVPPLTSHGSRGPTGPHSLFGDPRGSPFLPARHAHGALARPEPRDEIAGTPASLSGLVAPMGRASVRLPVGDPGSDGDAIAGLRRPWQPILVCPQDLPSTRASRQHKRWRRRVRPQLVVSTCQRGPRTGDGRSSGFCPRRVRRPPVKLQPDGSTASNRPPFPPPVRIQSPNRP